MNISDYERLCRFGKLIPLLLLLSIGTAACGPTGRIIPTTESITSTAVQPSDTLESSLTLAPSDKTFETGMVFGSGPFKLVNPTVGLSELASYKSELLLSFDGTNAGKPQKWTKTYTLFRSKEPAISQLTIEKTGDSPDPDPVFLAEVGGVIYEKRGDGSCVAALPDTEVTSDPEEPAGFLNPVIGADEAGTDKVNDLPVNHYTFDESAFGQTDIAKSTGELWVSSDRGFVVRYSLTTTGNADYFGEGTEGTLTWNYELTDVGKDFTVTLPEDCPAGLVSAPMLPDASNVENLPSLQSYNTSASLADISAFYQKEIPALGWMTDEEPSISETGLLIDYVQGDQTLSVVATIVEGETIVNVMLGKVEK